MAPTTRLRRQPGAAGRRTAVLVSLALSGLLLLGVLNRGGVSSGRGRELVQDADTAAQLYRLAKDASSAADFAKQLQQAGLMAAPTGGSSSSSSSSSGKGGSSGTQPAASKGSGASSKGGGSDSSKGDSSTGGSKGGGGGKKLAVPLLSKELAHKHARDGIIIVTWANWHFRDFVFNWVHHVTTHGITNYLVGAMDAETGQALAARGLNVFAMYDENAGQADTGLGKADFGWGSPTFHKMGRQKVDLARTFTGFGLDLCLCDVDTVWINDPTDYFERYAAADILASSDSLTPYNPPGDDGLELVEAIHSAMNIGLLFFRHGRNTTAFIDAWQQRLDADEKAWDQNVFNEVAHDGLLPFQSPPDQERLVYAANRTMLVGVLPVASFASGHTFFVQRLFEFQKVKPYVVHTTFQYGGSSGKRNRLREAMLWVDPPEYYGADGAGRFLSVDLEHPENPKGFQEQDQTMMEGVRFKTDWKEADMISHHVNAAGAQLRQLRTALHLAVALNRTLIMPKLISWCDRYWGPVEFCQIPGAFKTRLPFVAPMDHWLEPFNFNDHPDQMPAIDFREYSFLANERTPAALKQQRLVVTPDAAAKEASLRTEGGAKALRIPAGLNDEGLRAALAPHAADVQLLHFSSLEGSIAGFAKAEDMSRFNARLAHMAGFWCCKRVKEGEDGGVAYAPFLGPAPPR